MTRGGFFKHAIPALQAALLFCRKRLKPVYSCSKCKGHAVELPVWTDVNTLEQFGDFASFNYDHSTWCRDCNGHVRIEIDDELYDARGEERDFG